MDRNPNDLDNVRSGAAGSSGAAGTGAYGSSASGGSTAPGTMPGGTTGIGGTSGGYGSMGATESATSDGLGASSGMAGESRTEEMKERAQEGAEAAREKLAHAGERAREIKTSVEQKLADRLEQGASRLRQRGTATATSDLGTPAYAAAGNAGGTAAATDQRMSDLQRNVASGMEKTADWLRNGDMRASIEEQARTNPGRTLLVALGVGYLLGKALRR